MATVSSAGMVSAVSAGLSTITATSEGKTASASVTVQAVPVASVSVSPATATVYVSKTVQLSATPKDSAGNALTGRTIAWTSSNAAVATVATTGLVSGVGVGSATITATSGGKSGTASVTVALVPVASVSGHPTARCDHQGLGREHPHRAAHHLGDKQCGRGDGQRERARYGCGGGIRDDHRNQREQDGQRRRERYLDDGEPCRLLRVSEWLEWG